MPNKATSGAWSSAAAAFVAHLVSAPVGAQSLEDVCSAELEVFPLPSFESFDSNRDEVIELREARQCRSLSTVFEELDLDGNEKLTRSEYSSFATIWTERERSFGPGR